MNKQPLIIGLTGGIGTGKSTVAALFAKLAVPIIDADDISRELVQPGKPVLAKIVEYFGNDIIDASGQLRRRELRNRIFADQHAKQWLESQLHPEIYQTMKNVIKNYQNPYLIMVIPLLLEVGRSDFIDRVLVVDAPEALQLSRVGRRDKADVKQISAIMQSQLPRAQRLVQADDVIINDSDELHLQQQVLTLHEKYLNLAKL